MDRSVASLLISIFLLETGSGLLGIVIPVRAEIAGFRTEIIGVLGTLHYVGFVIGCIKLPGLVRRTGHVRSFSALAAIASCAILGYALTESQLAWMALRLAAGVCFAGMFMVTESWLNDRSTSTTRGRLLGSYMVATWVGVILGKLAYGALGQTSFEAFTLVAMAVVLSMVPLAVTNGAVPAIPRPSRLGLRELLKLAPAGFIGCLAIGLANSTFWTFAPLYARNAIGTGAPVSLFMVACVLGGAVFQRPIGRISDGMDRRWVILLLCVASAGVGLSIALADALSAAATYGLGFLFGAASLSVYSLCVAYANDRADPADYVDVSSYLLLVFGFGAIVGPLVSGVVVAHFGYPSAFLCMASAEIALALYLIGELYRTERVPPDQQVQFASQPPLTHGTQAVAGLNPETEAGSLKQTPKPPPAP